MNDTTTLYNEKSTAGTGTIRCAVYTRKSTDEGLRQEFNSLDAQRESAEAYIASQRHEGWVCIPTHYDDGGYTGGNMERPALKRLLTDIERGTIDCVVVYKVDRLSRSLLDFARIMGEFDGHGVSFVSVTQQFNTSSSMGRLTMNILLSFAQFEREIISERTRDKMSAARRKGKWVGGMPVLGYDIDHRDRRLVVNEDEAAQVRTIFELYLDHEALMPVVRELEKRCITTKRWTTKAGVERGGKLFTKTSLFRHLRNLLYTGKINYKGTVYDGEHEKIVDEDIWNRVQNILRRNSQTGGKDVRNKYGAVLKGLLHCVPCGTSMVHAYTVKNGKRYRYYVCLSAQQRGWSTCKTKSVNAHDIEKAVVEHIRTIGTNDMLVDETVRKARETAEKQLAELSTERRMHDRELRRLNKRLHALVNKGGSRETGQMADIQDQIRTLEQRITAIHEEVIILQREMVDTAEVTRALKLFDPLWESLTPREQGKVLRLLLERVGYDGRDETLSITFRSPGIKELCERYIEGTQDA